MGILSLAGNLVNGAESGLASASNAAWGAVGQPIFNAAYNASTGYQAPSVNPNATLATPAAAGGTADTTGSTSATATLTPSQVAAINAGFGTVDSNYDQQLGQIPGQIDDATNLVNSQYGSQADSINSAYDRGNVNLQSSRDQLGTDTTRSLQKLAQMARDSFDSYSTLIGANGAGDSSAPGQLSYALQKDQAQQRTDLYNNQADNLTQIGLKQGDLDASHSDQIQQLDAWKAQQVISIGQQFKAAQQSLEAAKAGADKDKLLALANANSDLVNQAISALSGVTATHQAATQAITDKLASLSAPGNPAALSATSYTPTAAPNLTTPAFATATDATDPTDSFSSAVPYTQKLLQTV